jgi:bifunctional polynucleotide phosphatase/kinase
MWDTLISNNVGVKINKEKSFFCGDAAGRKNGKVKDFSDSDLKFALNVGI